MTRSSCATRYQDGMVFQAACSTDAPKALTMIGFCVAAMTLASVAEPSLAKRSRNCARSMETKPAAAVLSAGPSADGCLSL
jgi:hypothetical protein